MAKAKKDKVKPEDPDVVKAKLAMGLPVGDPDPATTSDDERKSLEELNGLPPDNTVTLPNIRRKEYQRKMYSRLEGEAYLEANRSMLLAMDEKDQLETSRKSVVAEWKGIIDRKEEEIQGYRHQMSAGKSDLVNVEEQYDVEKELLRIVRVDNGAVIEDWRPLNNDEKQLNMADLDATVDAVDTEAAPGGDNALGLELLEDADPLGVNETPEQAEERRAKELGLGGSEDPRDLPGQLPVEGE